MANNISPHLRHMVAEQGRMAREKRQKEEDAARKAYKSDARKAAEQFGVSLEQGAYLSERGNEAIHSMQDGGKRKHGKR